MYAIYSNHIPMGIISLLTTLGRDGEVPLTSLTVTYYARDMVDMGWLTITPIALNQGTCILTDLGRRAFMEFYDLACLEDVPEMSQQELYQRRHAVERLAAGPGVLLPVVRPFAHYNYVVETLEPA